MPFGGSPISVPLPTLSPPGKSNSRSGSRSDAAKLAPARASLPQEKRCAAGPARIWRIPNAHKSEPPGIHGRADRHSDRNVLTYAASMDILTLCERVHIPKEGTRPEGSHGMTPKTDLDKPLRSLDEWDDHVAARYRPGKSEDEFRNYSPDTTPAVAEFYRQNHAGQTVEFVRAKRAQYLTLERGKKSIWEAAEYLNTLVDDSDPDTDLSQIEHLLQTAEAIRRDGHPRWFVLVGLGGGVGAPPPPPAAPPWPPNFCFPRVLCRQPRQPGAGISNSVRDLPT